MLMIKNTDDERVFVLFVLRCVVRAFEKDKDYVPPTPTEFAFAFNHAARLIHIWQKGNFVVSEEDQQVRVAFDDAYRVYFYPTPMQKIGKELYEEIRSIAALGMDEAEKNNRGKAHRFCKLACVYLWKNVREQIRDVKEENAALITLPHEIFS